MQNILLSTAYLPPICWFSLAAKAEMCILEKMEHFPKQTYRNRAHICSPNGILALSIPVVKGSKNHTIIKDVRISNNDNWQRLHWQSLQSAYRRSAYFEFYEDDFSRFYHQKFEYLFDFNLEIIEWLSKNLGLNLTFDLTDEYIKQYPDSVLDYRDAIHPKKPDVCFHPTYFQLFEPKLGFMPNVSSIDLLFSQGNRAKEIILSSKIQ